jgi:Tol biopolymer transport system component
LHFTGASSTVNWMPNSRKLLLSLLRRTYAESHLWIADPFRDSVRPLTGGSGVETDGAIAPDGKAIVYASTERQMDLVELPLDGSAPRSLLATGRLETAPAWSPVTEQFAYVTDRRGVNEIWLKSRKEAWSRPIVTPNDLPDTGEVVFTNPAFSPDGSRIVYGVTGAASNDRSSIWVSPVAGGPATKVSTDHGWWDGPTWSPEGAWLAFAYAKGGRGFLAKVEVGTPRTPIMIEEAAAGFAPSWSPDGHWITIQLPEGFGVVSPDGRNKRVLSQKLRGNSDVVHGWSRDSSTVTWPYATGHTRYCRRWMWGAVWRGVLPTTERISPSRVCGVRPRV